MSGLAEAPDKIIGAIDGAVKAFDRLFGPERKLPEIDTEDYDKLFGDGNVSLSPVVQLPTNAINEVIKEFNEMSESSCPRP